MTLGEKLRTARQNRGLTQKQVAGDRITRNMLSQIENDLATPSVKTLKYLAETLGVSESWLMTDSASGAELSEAREKIRAGKYAQAYDLASALPGESDEKSLLLCLASLLLAKQSLAENELEQTEKWASLAVKHNSETLYRSEEAECEAYWLRSRAALYGGKPAEDSLQHYKDSYQAVGGEAKYHLLRVRYYLENQQTKNAERELWMVTLLPDEHRAAYLILRGWIAVQNMKYRDAISYLRQINIEELPTISQRRKTYELLEIAYRETDDMKSAYEAAVKLRSLSK